MASLSSDSLVSDLSPLREERSTHPYLPFARPTLDEDTIAGVVEVLRSGWITTGPQVKSSRRH